MHCNLKAARRRACRFGMFMTNFVLRNTHTQKLLFPSFCQNSDTVVGLYDLDYRYVVDILATDGHLPCDL